MSDTYLIVQYLEVEGWCDRLTQPLARTIRSRGISTWKSYRVGRSEQCEIYIPWIGTLLGRVQATLIRNAQDPNYWIIDGLPNKPSRNGIAVNGAKVDRRQLLSHGDIISLAAGVRALYYNPPSIIDNLETTLTGIPDVDAE